MDKKNKALRIVFVVLFVLSLLLFVCCIVSKVSAAEPLQDDLYREDVISSLNTVKAFLGLISICVVCGFTWIIYKLRK